MAAKKIIMQVSYPGIGESPYKTVAFSPTITVEEACRICANKGGLKDKIGEYGLCIKDSGTWLKAGDSLEKYPLQNCAGLEYKPTPKKTTVVYESEEKQMEIDFSALASDILSLILESLGEPKSNEFGFSIVSESDGTKGPSVDYTKPLIDQASPTNTKIVVKKKSKIGGIFRRTESHRGTNRQSTFSSLGSGISKTRIFGVPLAQVAHPAKYGGLPAVVAKTIEYLEDTSLQLEGIFRISGNQSEVLAMKKAFDEGQDVNVRECSSPHVAAGLLKLYLRDLPEPLFTYSLYEIFMALYGSVKNDTVRCTYYKIIVDALPVPNRTLLFRLLPFLANVVKYSEINKMAIHNVATVFGPNILRSSDQSAMAMIQGTAAVNAITCDMIQNYEEITAPEENEDFISVAVTLYRYDGKSDSEVSFSEGCVVFVTKEDAAGWWEGEVNGEFGFFPANYVKQVLTLQKEDKPKPAKSARSVAPTPSSSTQSAAVKSSTASVAAEMKAALQQPNTVASTKASKPSNTVTAGRPSAGTTVTKPSTAPVVSRSSAGTTAGNYSSALKKPPASRRESSVGGSKQKFLAELEELNSISLGEKNKMESLLTLVNNLANDIDQLKQGKSGSLQGGSPEENSLHAQVQQLSNSNATFLEELNQTKESISEMKSQVDSLKQGEVALKRDLKILGMRSDRLT